MVVPFLGCQSDGPGGEEEQELLSLEREKAGGETTSFLITSNGFNNPAPNLSSADLDVHLKGDVQFDQVFVTAPAEVNEGLGSVFNNSSCVVCHPKDGRSSFPADFSKRGGLLLRASLQGEDVHGGPVGVPGFGKQIQNQAIFGYEPEADYKVVFEEHTETLSDGTEVNLRKPVFSLENPYIPLQSGVMLSARMPSPIFGLGLLEAVPEAAILQYEDVDDADGDGISGKANYVWDPAKQAMALGRFGWKANASSILTQVAGAYLDDMGITTYVFPNEACDGQDNCQQLDREGPELSAEKLDAVVFYCKTLAVPAARDVDSPEVQAGERIFGTIGCAQCHVPQYTTGPSEIAALANQTIYPYSDMLVHDLGEGLADGRPDFLANGQEWRTRPLWGIGLTKLINGHTDFLHDGRARNLTEAIMWHGGEANSAKSKFAALSTADREALMTFLNTL